MTTIQHQTDLVEAYALGVLEPQERTVFEEHIAECTDCRKLAHASEEAAQMLGFAVRPAAPPLRCKRTVLGRIEREQFLRTPTPRRTARRIPLATWTTVAAVFAMMLTGGWAFSLQGQLASANSRVAALETNTAQRATETAQMQASMGQVISYVADGEQVCLLQNAGAKAKCLARPGENNGLMVVSGLAPLPPGQTYQLWFADAQTQVPLNIFNTEADGKAKVEFAPNESLDHFDAIMITVEDADGAQTPSNQTVLTGQFY